ncbi:MAG: non-ribosomal peptide synthetase, partial [Blastocatellia bacterium]
MANGASRNIDSAISQLEMLTAAEKRQLLFAFNSARADYKNDKPIECLIDIQVRLRPESTAVVFEDQHLTYDALDGRAEGIANRLRIAGAGPESVVAVCIERSLEMMTGLVGVLKSCAAYVPLDPDYPRERLAFMLDDSCAAVLLAQRRLLDLLPVSNAQRISIDEPGRGTVSPAIARLERSDLIERLAYVIYTSGSTGRPKGVSISHRAICNRLLWMQKAFPLAADDRVLQKTPVSFDASVWELFLPLIAGAQVILCRQDGHKDTSYMASLITEARVTVLQVVPSLLQALLAEPKLAECVSLRRVFSGGEALSAPATRRFLEVGSWKLTNLYGPTETSIDATFFECERGDDRVTIPIGRPLDDVRVHILGAGGELAPLGVPGEIHIGGAGLARGYLKRPDLSAERFVPDEFGDRPGERLYKSGDVGRYLDDGLIEHLGRADDQIKLRGLRIELGEIEFAISGHPDVARSIVMVSGDQAGDRKLVGYYVSKGAQLSARDLSAYLAGRLPQYMIPSRLVPLKSIPLAPNGKVDRPALANFRDGYAEGQDQTALLGFTPTEQILAGSWSSILGVERVGVDDSFFALGGHSLLATQAVSRIRDAFSVEVPLRVLFEHPTVNDLAKYIEAAQRAGRGLQIPRIERCVRQGFFPLSYEQQRLWFMEQMEPGSAAYNIGVVVRVSGRLDVESLRKSVNEVIRRHETLRT